MMMMMMSATYSDNCFAVWYKVRSKQHLSFLEIIAIMLGGARGVMVIVAGIGHGDTSSNPGLIAFHIALIPLGKV